MKRTLASFASLWVLTGIFASCSGSDPSPQEPSKESATGQGPKTEQPEPEPDSSGENSEGPDAAIDCSILKATGNDPGEIPVDLVRMASNGKELSLRSYCNETLLVLNGTAY